MGEPTKTREEGARPPGDRTFRVVFLGAFVGLVAFLVVPVTVVLSRGLLFGGDWGQYILTAQLYLHPQANQLEYPYPVLPILYLPVALLAPNVVAVGLAAATIGVLLLLALYLASYRLLRTLTGSSWSALVGALTFATAPLLLDELGWAGQAQYLAIVFGLLALERYLRAVEPGGRLRPSLETGALLALGALTEPYSTAFFLFALVALLLLRHRLAVFHPRRLLSAIAVLLPGLVAFGVLYFANQNLAGNTVGIPIAAHAAYLPMYSALFLRLTFHSVPVATLYVAVVVVYVVLWRRIRAPDPLARAVVPALWIAWVPVFLFLTPSVDTDRALYFALVPLVGMVAEIARGLPGIWAHATDPGAARVAPYRTRWGPMPRGRSMAAPALALIVLLLVGAQVGVASHTFYSSLTYYSYPSGVLQQLSPLESENGTLLLLSPNLGTFASAWASGRNTYFGPPIQPATFTRPDQQAAVITGTLLSNGPAWIDAGSAWVVNGAPGWITPAPAVLESRGSYLISAFALNSSQATVSYAPAGDPAANTTVALSSAPSIVAAVGPANLTTTYRWPGLTVVETESVDAGGVIAIDLAYAFSATSPRWISIALSLPALLPTTESGSSAIPTSLSVTETYKNGYLPTAFPNTVGVRAGGLAGSVAYRAAQDPTPASIVANLTPTAPNASSVSVAWSIDPQGLANGPVSVVTEASVLAANDIAWVAVERSSPEQYLERFLNDPTFALVRSSAYYLTFQTRWT
ncbi:MAG TPA: hypothetical protein VMG81_00610 [Thermoplasmata archaeon]|nr:hypothetical protein [Thermoplasmata archaeon]